MIDTNYKVGDVIRIYNEDDEIEEVTFAGYYILKGHQSTLYEAFRRSNGDIISLIDFHTLSPDILLFDIETKEGLQYYNYLMENDLTSTQETYRGFLDYLRYKREIRQNPRDRLNIQRQLLRSQLPFQYEQKYDRVRGRPTISMVPRTMRRRYYGNFPDSPPNEVKTGEDDMFYWPEREIQKPLNLDDRIESKNLNVQDVQEMYNNWRLNNIREEEYSWIDNPAILYNWRTLTEYSDSPPPRRSRRTLARNTSRSRRRRMSRRPRRRS